MAGDSTRFSTTSISTGPEILLSKDDPISTTSSELVCVNDTVNMTGMPDSEETGSRPSKTDGTGRSPVLCLGSWIGFALAGVTVVTLALAVTALPDDVPYPFTSDVIAAQWPGDYLWMYPAMLLMLLFIAFVASLHEYASVPRKPFSLLGLCFGSVAAAILLMNYFIQVTVVPLSLEKGQLDGWAMLTMYNPNGVFLALEELGFLLMSLALALLAPVFTGVNSVERTIRWLLVLSFVAVIGALVAVSWAYGKDRGDVFEVIVITIVWVTLIVAGPLVATVFRRAAAHP